jgi:pSer/pThr/pTyr-binding forkhead associated (FHA) protein
MLPSVTLKVVEGSHAGQELDCTDHIYITIGRSTACNLPLQGQFEDLTISRRHCLIAVNSEWVEIRDLESRNGTYVNGVRLGFPQNGEPDGSMAFKRRLKDGDQIALGTTVLQVTIRQPAANATPVCG